MDSISLDEQKVKGNPKRWKFEEDLDPIGQYQNHSKDMKLILILFEDYILVYEKNFQEDENIQQKKSRVRNKFLYELINRHKIKIRKV